MNADLLSVQTCLVGFDDNVFLPGNVQARGLNLLGCRGVLVRAYDLLHLLRRHGEARRAGPDGIPLCVEDGGFIDVAGAEKAGKVGGAC